MFKPKHSKKSVLVFIMIVSFFCSVTSVFSQEVEETIVVEHSELIDTEQSQAHAIEELGLVEQLNFQIENTSGESIDGKGNGERTQVLGNVGLNSEQMQRVAQSILNVANSMSETYSVSDGIGLTTYVLRFMAEIGEYEIVHRDIMILVRAFETLTGGNLDQAVHDILAQIRKIKFGRKDAQFFAQIYSKDPIKGMTIPINQVSEDPDAAVREIRTVTIKDGATLSFIEASDTQGRSYVKNFVKNPVKILGVIESLSSSLNQVNKEVILNIEDYLLWDERPADALYITIQGISIDVLTDTILKDIVLEFENAVSLPGMNNGLDPLPSFVISAKTKLFSVKLSIDE